MIQSSSQRPALHTLYFYIFKPTTTTITTTTTHPIPSHSPFPRLILSPLSRDGGFFLAYLAASFHGWFHSFALRFERPYNDYENARKRPKFLKEYDRFGCNLKKSRVRSDKLLDTEDFKLWGHLDAELQLLCAA